MPILLEIKFYILWATNPAFEVFATPTDFWPNGITLIQYRDTLLETVFKVAICSEENLLYMRIYLISDAVTF